MRGLCLLLGDADDEVSYSTDQAAFMDFAKKSISVALQRGNAQTIVRRASLDRFASGRSVPRCTTQDHGLGTY